MFHIENIWWNKYSSSVRQYAAPLCVFECYLLGVNSFWHQPKRHEIFACYFSKKLKINVYKKMQWWTINYFLYQTISEIINTDKRMKISLDCVVHQRTGKNDLILNIDDTSMILIPKLHKLWLFMNSVICWKWLTIWIMKGPYLIWLSPFLWFYSWNMPRYSDTHD